MDKPAPIHVACAIDESFTFPLSVTIVSLLENNKDLRVKIHLFSCELSDVYVQKYNELITCRYHQEFEFYRLCPNDFADLIKTESTSPAYYYRILIPQTIRTNVDRFLYLDADTMVVKNIKDLFGTQLGNAYFGAVTDTVALSDTINTKHKIPKNYLYFNSGVMLIDRKKWIEADASHKVANYLIHHKELCDYKDQDGFNAVMYENRFTLSPKWNQLIGIHFIHPTLLNKIYSEDTNEALYNAHIVHFNGREKPWHYASAHPYRKLFLQYAKLVANFGTISNPTLKMWVKRYLIYQLIGWKRVCRYYYFKSGTERFC